MDIRLSQSEKLYKIRGAVDNFRSDGRGKTDYRPIVIETGVLLSVNGSARVQLASTDLLIGIKAEIVSIDSVETYQNRINFYVDCSANATPLFEGRGGQDYGEEIALALDEAYNNRFAILDLKKLIISSMHAWKLYVDIVILQCGGNIIDAASFGVKAALFDTRLPGIRTHADDKGKVSIDIAHDADLWRLDVSRAPLFVSVNKLGSANVIDISLQEKACCRAALWIALSLSCSLEEAASGVSDEYFITATRQFGNGGLQKDTIDGLISLAVQVARCSQESIARYLLSERSEDSFPSFLV